MNINRNTVSQVIAENINSLYKRIEVAANRSGRNKQDIKIIAVSKNFSADYIRAAYKCGLRDFGENRLQEAINKFPEIMDIRNVLTMHFIGHLQTNKVKTVIELFDIIHSIDSVHLADKVSQRSFKKTPVFLEVNVSGEHTKYGFLPEQLEYAVSKISTMPNLVIMGFMTVAPIANNPEDVRPIFKKLKQLNDLYKFKELSMGMSDDFEVAIEEGATMIRIGRAIFGERSK